MRTSSRRTTSTARGSTVSSGPQQLGCALVVAGSSGPTRRGRARPGSDGVRSSSASVTAQSGASRLASLRVGRQAERPHSETPRAEHPLEAQPGAVGAVEVQHPVVRVEAAGLSPAARWSAASATQDHQRSSGSGRSSGSTGPLWPNGLLRHLGEGRVHQPLDRRPVVGVDLPALAGRARCGRRSRRRRRARRGRVRRPRGGSRPGRRRSCRAAWCWSRRPGRARRRRDRRRRPASRRAPSRAGRTAAGWPTFIAITPPGARRSRTTSKNSRVAR